MVTLVAERDIEDGVVYDDYHVSVTWTPLWPQLIRHRTSGDGGRS